MILFNAKIYSMDARNTVYEALEIEGDKIAKLGNNKEILDNKKPMDIVLDLGGKAVVPGLVDTHTHFSSASISELEGEILNPQSVKEILEYIKTKTKMIPKGDWIYLRNIYPTRLSEGRFPTIEELDAVAPEHPIYINAAYAAQVNTKSLEISGINKDTIPLQGKICRDKVDGKLNGILLGCGRLIRKHMPATPVISNEEIEKAILILQEKYSQVGITSIVEASTPLNIIEIYNKMHSEDKLNLRIIYTKLPDVPEYHKKEFVEYINSVETPDEWGKVGFLKLFIDGGFLTGTSYMRKSYSKEYKFLNIDSGFKGNIGYDKEQLIYWIEKAIETNLQMTAHCTGNASLDILLAAYKEVNKKQSIIKKRFTVIHADFTDKKTLKEIKELGIIIISQPMWHYLDSLALSGIMDEETLNSFLPYKDMLDEGVVACGGSDHMCKLDSLKSVNPYNPFLGLYNLVTRCGISGEEVFGEQKISRYEALKMYTSNAAYLTFDEDKRGTIEAGKLADMAVLSEDYFTCDQGRIPNISSELTIVGGKVAYKKE